MSEGAARSSWEKPGWATRSALAAAGLVPWFAMFSGVYGLYFYVVLLAVSLFEWLFFAALALVAPLGVLLLILLPAGTLWAASGHGLHPWLNRLTMAGCLVSMGFIVAFGGLMVVVSVLDVSSEPWDWFLLWRVSVLAPGPGPWSNVAGLPMAGEPTPVQQQAARGAGYGEAGRTGNGGVS